MKFIEAQLEKAFAELLGQEGFPHHLGITITRKPEEVLIEEDMQTFLLSQYAGQGITVHEVKKAEEQAGLNSFVMTPKRWIDTTNAIGITSKSGRCGGTFAHKSIVII